jgi:hypothetical protein
MIAGEYLTGTVLKMKVSDSEVLKAKSGRWVGVDGAGYLQMGSATSVDIMGWVTGSLEETSSSTAGGTSWFVETDFLSKLWVMPACNTTGVGATEAELLAAIGETCDITMESTSYQYCDIGLSDVDILLVYGYIYEGSAYGKQYAIVKPNVAKLVYTSH